METFNLYITHKNNNYWIGSNTDNRGWFKKILFGAFYRKLMFNHSGATLNLVHLQKFRILWDLGDYDEHERLINET